MSRRKYLSRTHVNYVIFINSKKHSNDANFEFPYLIEDKNIKILAQENVCELIFKMGKDAIPSELLDKLSLKISEREAQNDRRIFDIILENRPEEVEKLFNHDLKYIKEEISDNSKRLVIKYIQDLWQQDPSFEGTVRPMKWLDTYFDFITEDLMDILIKVFEEFTSSYRSFKAEPYTRSIITKINLNHLIVIAEDFIKFSANVVMSSPRHNLEYVIAKIKELKESKKISDNSLNDIMEEIIEAYELFIKIRSGNYNQDDKRKYSKKIGLLQEYLEFPKPNIPVIKA